MYSAVEGMKVGGKVIFSYFNYQNNSLFFYLRKNSYIHIFFVAQRRVIVPPEAGYGKKGQNEIPVRRSC